MYSNNLSPAEMTRYSLQIAMEGWGREAQEKVKSSRVLIVGADGLASMVAQHLLATGVGALRLVDPSRITLADLNTTILYRERDLGKNKASVAERRLREVNPFVTVEGQGKHLTPNNVFRVASGCQLLIEASRDPNNSFLLNQAAVRYRLPLLYAWLGEMEGFMTTFWPGQGPCLACAYPDTLPPCPSALMGPLPGIMGSLQALEALRILGGLPPALLGRRLVFQGKTFTFTEELLYENPHCPVCRHLRQASGT
jgi:molybdopterin/thiamine biosynthesis adenylyltransferase|uniref:HesA/MoeB/ThiF family protein n=1 Tax=Desulfobacca acetoxidans TaxID=60893 RepID=A0A7V6DNP1_9BACT